MARYRRDGSVITPNITKALRKTFEIKGRKRSKRFYRQLRTDERLKDVRDQIAHRFRMATDQHDN